MANGNGDPSTIRKIRSLVRYPIERAWLAEERARADAAQERALTASYEAAERTFEQVVRQVKEDPGDWIPTDSLGERTLTEQEHVDLRKAAVRASFENSHAIGYLRTLNRFVMGKGPVFRVELEGEHDNETLIEAIDDWFDEFERLNGWDRFEDEFAWRTWRDGEVFVRHFAQPRDGPVAGTALDETTRRFLGKHGVPPSRILAEAPRAPRGMVFVRFIAPELVNDPTGKISHGIITSANDVQTPLAYVLASPAGKVEEIVPASDILHYKIRVDSDNKRGRSQLESILKRMRQYERWLESRINLSIVRSAIAFIKRLKSAQSVADVQGVRDAQAVETKTGARSERRLKMLNSPTAIHTGPNVEYEFLSPNLQASDAQADGRQIQLDMAASVGMAEYIFTGDASNANYASTLVAESPTIREFESQRDDLEPELIKIRRWVLVEAARVRAIPGLTPELAARVEISVEWPQLEVRDILKHAQRNALLNESGVMSKQTWAALEGLDWKQELERIESELEGELGFSFPFGTDADDDGTSDDDGDADEADGDDERDDEEED